jgi:adenosylcobinamide-GDP ribazoletransferase
MTDHAARSGGRRPWWAPVALSWSFLTVLPAPGGEADGATRTSSLAYFPLVGFGLGGVLGGLGALFDLVLSPGMVAVLILAAGALLTGGLHLDGLMDTADGVFGGRTVERRLEIMRDSRVGSFGVIAGGLALLGQYSALANLTGWPRLAALVIALGVSRWGMALALVVFPSARAGGLGAAFQGDGGRHPLTIATVLLVIALIANPVLAVVSVVATLLVVWLGGRFFVAKLGGLTGDTYGCLAVSTECVVFYLAVAIKLAPLASGSA